MADEADDQCNHATFIEGLNVTSIYESDSVSQANYNVSHTGRHIEPV